MCQSFIICFELVMIATLVPFSNRPLLAIVGKAFKAQITCNQNLENLLQISFKKNSHSIIYVIFLTPKF